MAGVRVPVEFDGDFSQLTAGLERSLAGVSQGLTSAGGALTRGLTVPLVGLGALAAREFAGFESSLTKIENHTSLTRGEIETLSPAIRDIGTTAGLSGTEAADAFFFLQSGLGDSAKAMDALDAASRGSAVGLGTTEDVSKALVSVMANYGDEAGTATQIMETFGSAAQASSLDADQMAIGLRGIIPQASLAGIGLDDLAATMAVISPNFNTGAEAGTAMEAALRSIVAPTKEAETMLEDAGTSAAELSKIAGTRGLSGAMKFLGETFDGSQKDLTRLLGSSEAASAVMGFLGADADFVARTFGDVEKGTFSLDEAFKNLSDDAGFRVTQSMARMKDTLLDIGGVVLPIVADALEKAAGVVQSLGDAFTKLPAPAQTAILGIAGIAAAIGPALLVAGQFAGALSALAGAGGLGAVAQGALKFLGPVGLIVGALLAAYQSSEPFRVALAELGATIQQVAAENMPAFLEIGNIISTQLLPVLSSLFTQAAGALGGLLAAILPVVGTLISELTPVILQLVTTILPPLIALLAQAAGVIATVVVPIISQLAALFTTVLAPAIQRLMPIVSVAFAAFGQVISAAITVLSGLITFLTGVFTGNWSQAWAGIQTIFAGVVAGIMAVVRGWQNSFTATFGVTLDQVGRMIANGLKGMARNFVSFASQVIASVRRAFSTVVSTVSSGISNALSAVRRGWNSIVSATSSAFSRVVSTVSRGISGAVSAIRGGWNNAVGATSAAFGRIVSTVVSGASRVASSVASGFARAVSAARAAMSRMASAVRSGVSTVIGALRSVVSRAQGAVSGLGGALYGAGRSLISGLIGGIRAAAGAVASAARSVVQNAINAARSALGIASPSKVFMEIGKNTGQGMALGLDATRGLVQAAADRSLVPDISSAIGPRSASSAPRTEAGVADGGGGGTVVNLNEYGPRTDSAKRREIDWQLMHPTRGRTFQSGALAIP